MERKIEEGKTFNKIDYRTEHLPKAEYEDCLFTNCDFSGSDLSSISFIECQFQNCNFSSARINKSAFQSVKFIECKLTGVLFDDCSEFLFSIHCERCNLGFSSVHKRKLRDCSFTDCNLTSLDLSNADVSGIIFHHCDLQNAVFDDTIAEKTDFRTAFNYSIDPTRNRIRKAKFALPEAIRLLDTFDILIS